MGNITLDLQKIGNSLAAAAQNLGSYSAQAAARANGISAQAQSAQARFNSESANQANMLNEANIANQYGFNSAMMSAANNYNTAAWQTAADWNEAMWQKQADFNAEQAEIQRNWQEKMANTQYQRAVQDMSKAGLNPILAVTGGGIGTGVPGGATASVGGSQMSSAQSQMASGGLLGAESASIGNYTGQMEYMSTTLALIGALMSSLSSAEDLTGGIQSLAEDVEESLDNTFKGIQDTPLGDMLDGMVDIVDSATDPAKRVWEILTGKDKKKNNSIKAGAEEAQFLRYNAINKSTYKYTIPKG